MKDNSFLSISTQNNYKKLLKFTLLLILGPGELPKGDLEGRIATILVSQNRQITIKNQKNYTNF